MVEVLIDPIDLKGNATAVSKASRIFYGKTSVSATASIEVLVVKIMKTSINVIGIATVPLTNSTIIKYTKAIPIGTALVKTKTHKFKTVQGELVSRARLEAYVYDREIGESMLSYLPQFYQEFKDFRSLFYSEANEFTRLNAKLEELFNQFFISTATYSINDWENFVGVKKRNEAISDRRLEIKKKATGIGTVTPSVLKNVMDEFYFSEINELPSAGIVDFRILGKRGEPSNIKDIREALDEVIPRHLEVKFKYSYLPWEEVETFGLTWEQAEDFTYQELEEVFLIEPPYPYE
ncbi:putative phage tail protein [Sporosarcina sp. CAU 1771]